MGTLLKLDQGRQAASPATALPLPPLAMRMHPLTPFVVVWFPALAFGCAMSAAFWRGANPGLANGFDRAARVFARGIGAE